MACSTAVPSAAPCGCASRPPRPRRAACTERRRARARSLRRDLLRRRRRLLPLHAVEDHPGAPERGVRLEEHLDIAVIGIVEHLLLLLERPLILGDDAGEGLDEARDRGPARVALAHHALGHAADEMPDMVAAVDRRVRVVDDIAALDRGIAE